MIHRRVETIICVILGFVIPILIPYYGMTMIIDILPINKNLSTHEFIDKVVDKGSTYDYIRQSDYILIIETKDDGEEDYHFVLKGKISGFINTDYDTSDRRRLIYSDNKIGKLGLNYLIKKHRDNYLLELITENKDVMLYDNKGNEIESITSELRKTFFVVQKNVKDDYEIYGELKGKQVKVTDTKEIKSIAIEYKDSDYINMKIVGHINGAVMLLTILFFAIHIALATNRYADNVIDAVYYKDIDEANRLLHYVHKRQTKAVYKKLCKKIDKLDSKVLEFLDV